METSNLRGLRIFLTVFGVVFLALFVTVFVLTATNSPLVQEGGALISMRWGAGPPHVELMLEMVYIVWGVFLLLASRQPLAYRSFLVFTAWANLAHGLLMVPQALTMPGFTFKLFTDVPFCIVLAIGIFALLPKGAERAG